MLVLGVLGGGAGAADAPTARIDVAALAREFAAANPSFAQSRVVALVSLSMPPASLRRLARKARLADIPLVLRGLKGNSMKETVAALRELKAHPLATWQVDPRLFRALGVGAVPAVAVVAGDAHLLVRGDVPLRYALAKLAARDSPLAAAAAKALAAVAAKDERER